MSEILLGTSGWSYAEWEGILYPQRENKLRQYSTVFPTAEINSTFYALPKPGMALGWVKYTPPDFKFSAKLPQTITHKKLLNASKDIESDLNQFLKVMKPLTDSEKLICVLAQLPPFLRSDMERLEAFLSILPSVPRVAIEFRHPSWLNEEAFDLLRKYQVAYTVVDEPLLPPDVHLTSDLAYFRWHGKGNKPWFNYRYSEEELREFLPRVQEAAENTKMVVGYFNNHFHGYAPENCLQIMQMLGIITPNGPEALRRVTFYRKRRIPAQSTTLETWTGEPKEASLEIVLKGYADKDAFKEAALIPNSDFSLREESKKRIAAYIADTTVEIDLENHTLLHYCPVWKKASLEKKFCHHVIKLLQNIELERAKKIMSQINSEIEKWDFKAKYAVDFPNQK